MTTDQSSTDDTAIIHSNNGKGEGRGISRTRCRPFLSRFFATKQFCYFAMRVLREYAALILSAAFAVVCAGIYLFGALLL